MQLYQDVHEWQHDRLQPIFAALGYTMVTRHHVKGTPLSIKYSVTPESMVGQIHSTLPSVDLYVKDAFPNARDEAFLHVWNWCGRDGKRVAQHVADALNKAGIKSRVTTHEKYWGVRFATTYDQYQQERKPVDPN
jgi:uncharacterized glyoxalase superfamily protein PhnB